MMQDQNNGSLNKYILTCDESADFCQATVDYHPLSSPQREIWVDQQLYPNVPLYNIGGYIEINGNMDPGLFESAVNLLIKRYEALRTIFISESSDIPVQSFLEELTVSLPFHDFSCDSNASESALSWMQQDFTRLFELEEAPLFRFSLLEIKKNQFYFYFVYHHLIIDGYGTSIATKALGEIYSALLLKQESLYISKPYCDFIKNDLLYSESSRFLSDRQYWMKRFETLPAPIFPPYYSKIFDGRISTSERSITVLPLSLYEHLKTTAKAFEVTVYHLILGVLYTYFTRISQTDEFVVGLPVSNRTSAVFKEMLGLFVGVNVYRFSFGRTLSFKDLIQNISRELKRNYRYHRLPLGELNRGLKLSQTGHKLFDISVSYENHKYDTLFGTFPGFTRALVNGYEQTPLMIHVRELHDDEDVNIDFVYNQSYFNSSEISLLQLRFVQIIEYVSHHVCVPVCDIPLLTQHEQQQMLAWNQTENHYPQEKTIIDLFQAQAAKTPNNIALVFEGRQLRYEELNTKANYLAHYLIKSGVASETIVGICVTRSMEMVVAMLGVLKAGGAYVPLDPDYPVSRLQYILEDSKIKILITQTDLLKLIPASDVQNVDLKGEWKEIAAYPGSNPALRNNSSNLAYLIYTSGTTGLPKGVMIQHDSVVNMIISFNQTYHTSTTDKVLQQASFSFDVSVGEILPIICAGGVLVIASREVIMDPDKYAAFIEQNEISIFGTTPLLLSNLSLNKHKSPNLRLIFSGGEALSYNNVSHLLDTFTIINGYGPTEATIGAMPYTLNTNQTEKENKIPIGKPLTNYRIYVLDNQLQHQPIGVSGELCIAGVGLARGYLNQKKLTEEKFVQVEVFGTTQRVYKTGDLARWLPDGNLEFLGRIDQQIKLRGFRIELGEIEAVLGQHSLIKEKVVVLHTDTRLEKLLVAYYVPNREAAIENDTLRKFLKQKLPDYMIPSSFLQLKTMPLTQNGKIDLKALPEPDLICKTEDIAPQTETEKLLCALWSTVLGVDVTSIACNFFETGGHSLTATKLVSRIRESFGIEMPLRTIFENATLHDQAQWLDNQQHNTSLPAIQPLPEDTPLTLSFAQQRLWFLSKLDGQSSVYNMPAALLLEGELNKKAFQEALTALIKRHDSLRHCFPEVEGKATVYLKKVYNPLNETDLSALTETNQQQRITEFITQHSQKPFNIIIGPLFNLHLLKLGEQRHILLFNMHHIISDGWSINILIKDWSLFYSLYSKNQQPQLTGSEIRYTDYAAWQRNWLQGEVLERYQNIGQVN